MACETEPSRERASTYKKYFDSIERLSPLLNQTQDQDSVKRRDDW